MIRQIQLNEIMNRYQIQNIHNGYISIQYNTNTNNIYLVDKINKKIIDLGKDSQLWKEVQQLSSAVSNLSTTLTGAFVFKGTVSSVVELPLSGNKVGDLWVVTSDSSEYAWAGEERQWEQLGPGLSSLQNRVQTLQYEVSGLNLFVKGLEASQISGTVSSVTELPSTAPDSTVIQVNDTYYIMSGNQWIETIFKNYVKTFENIKNNMQKIGE